MEIREVRRLIQWHNSLRKLCKIAFSSTDASLYLFPYAVQGKYYYGSKTMPAKQSSITFNFIEDIFKSQTPKLSIHEKGQVHVYVGNEKAGPLLIPPLLNLTGQHIATVCPDAFESLPPYTKKPQVKGSEIDHIIYAVDEAVNGKLLVYVNGQDPEFDANDCGLKIILRRTTIARPLYIGVKVVDQPLIGNNNQKGITIISGWNPLYSSEESFNFLYIRGE
jgi:hypothetical protein